MCLLCLTVLPQAVTMDIPDYIGARCRTWTQAMCKDMACWFTLESGILQSVRSSKFYIGLVSSVVRLFMRAIL